MKLSGSVAMGRLRSRATAFGRVLAVVLVLILVLLHD